MAVDINLLNSITGNDPLIDVYRNQGLFDEGNILPYSADPKVATDPAWAKEMYNESIGYTRPYGSESSLYIRDIDKFGMQPTGPLYGAPIMDTDYLNREAFEGKAIGVDKFGNEITRPQTNEELMTFYLNAPQPWKRDFPHWMVEQNPTITERNKQIGETIGHEARHQLLGENPQFYEDIDDSLVSNIGATGEDKHEILNRMLDFQAYNDPDVYTAIYDQMHGDMPRHLYSPIADKFYNQATAFTNYMKPSRRVGPPMTTRPLSDQGLGDAGIAEKIAAQDRAKKNAAIQEAVNIQIGTSRGADPIVPQPKPKRPDTPSSTGIGGAQLSSGMSTGQHAAFRMAKGGYVDIPLPGRSRDI